jgi:uncharacterized protein YndB with AHSA1/START domain
MDPAGASAQITRVRQEMAVQAAQVSIEMDAAPEAVWRTLTTPESLGNSFFGSRVETDWKLGSPIHFRGEWKGKQFEDKGEILAFSPSRLLRFTHWSDLSGVPDVRENRHVVTFELVPAGAKTKVTLTQENQDGKSLDPNEKQELVKNWTAILERLKGQVKAPAR